MVIVRTIFASVLKHVQYSLLPKMILFALSDDVVFVSFSSLEYMNSERVETYLVMDHQCLKQGLAQ